MQLKLLLLSAGFAGSGRGLTFLTQRVFLLSHMTPPGVFGFFLEGWVVVGASSFVEQLDIS